MCLQRTAPFHRECPAHRDVIDHECGSSASKNAGVNLIFDNVRQTQNIDRVLSLVTILNRLYRAGANIEYIKLPTPMTPAGF